MINEDSIIERIIRLELRIEILERNVLNQIEKEIPSRLNAIKFELISSQSEMIEQSVQISLTRAFKLLDVDIEDSNSVNKFRDDVRFGGVFRDGAQKGFLAFLAALFGGLGLSILIFFKEKLGLK